MKFAFLRKLLKEFNIIIIKDNISIMQRYEGLHRFMQLSKGLPRYYAAI